VSAALRPGLCSVTLRHLDVAGVVRAAAEAGLEVIEWGGDVHVPPGDADAARQAHQATVHSGLCVASYGSYYLRSGGDLAEWKRIVHTARLLEAPRIRVWAGSQGSAEASEDHRARVVADVRQACDMAAEHDIEVAFEFHGSTLTDDVASTLRLLRAVDRPNIATYWQPPVGMPDEQAIAGLRAVLDHVVTVHVFSWWPHQERLPLMARAQLWRGVFTALAETGRDFDALLEFVPDDDQALLAAEARSLRNLIA
jgi:3-dehydroshikimate dehydratase